MTTHSE